MKRLLIILFLFSGITLSNGSDIETPLVDGNSGIKDVNTITISYGILIIPKGTVCGSKSKVVTVNNLDTGFDEQWVISCNLNGDITLDPA